MQMELFPISVLEGKNVLQHAAFKGYHANILKMFFLTNKKINCL